MKVIDFSFDFNEEILISFQSMAGLKELEELYLANCKINSEILMGILRPLRKLSKLKKLDISSNPILSLDHAFQTFLRDCKTLETLDFRNIIFESYSTFYSLRDALLINKNIKNIFINTDSSYFRGVRIYNKYPKLTPEDILKECNFIQCRVNGTEFYNEKNL
jgi:Leucine-rich repeat (LRR) protein